MANDTKKSKPMLFGSATMDADALHKMDEMDDAGYDNSYVPGYSEERRKNELRVRDGQSASNIDHLYWVRTSRVDGSDVDYRDAVAVSRLGYRAATVDDLSERGWAMPPAAHIGADGLIRREDLALAIVDKDIAKKNKDRLARKNAEFEGQTRQSETGVVTVATEKHGRSVSLADAKQALLGN